MTRKRLVSLGFTEQRFPVGTHICQIYSSDQERQEAILKFVRSGLHDRERTACFSDKTPPQKIRQFVVDAEIPCQHCEQSGQLIIGPARARYLEGERFDPDRMLNFLETFSQLADAEGQTAARVIGEMHSDVCRLEGGEQVMEYEACVSLLLQTYPVTVVCQYDVEQFSGAFIMDILKSHPMMVVNGAVVHNPFYVDAATYLALIRNS